jgi:hypothetical protein
MKSFNQFVGSDSLNETIAVAKKYLFDKYKDQIERVRLNPEDLAGEENDEAILRKKESIWLKNNKDYNAILEIVGRNQGYVGPFVKFRFEQGAPIEAPRGSEAGVSSLRRLFDLIKEMPQEISQLPMTIEEYAETKDVNGVRGFEALWDLLFRTKERRKHKWIVDKVNGELRRSIKETLTKEEISELYDAAKVIDDIDERDGEFEVTVTRDGREITVMTTHKDSLLAKSNAIRRGKDWYNAVRDQADGLYNANAQEIINSIVGVSPHAAIVYNKRGFLAFSTRTEKGQKEVCKIVQSIWCINYGHWSSYGGKEDAVQINIFDFNRPVSDVFHLIGMTIGKNGELRNSHDMKDDNIKARANNTSSVSELLTTYKYPPDMIRAITSWVPIEYIVKRTITDFKLESVDPMALFTEILLATTNINFDSMPPEGVDVIIDLANDLISTKLSADTVYQLYMENKFFSTVSAKLFNTLFPDLKEDIRKKIIESTIEGFSDLEEVIVYYGTKKYPNVTAAVKNKAEILRILETGESIERKS